ncbi:MAG: CDP-alcohol phosphatidyltransferase family protein [Actinomycetota bacterium]
MLDRKLRATWNRVMIPVGNVVAKSRLSPNALTGLGLVIQAGSSWAILQGRLLLAAVVALVAAIFDLLDGAVARSQKRESPFGALVDSTSDRLADMLFFLPLMWLYGVSPDLPDRENRWIAGLALAALVFSFLVSYVKARAEGLGFDAKVGLAERAERVAIMILGLAFDQVLIALVLLTLTSAITFVQRVLHVRKQALPR